MSDIEILVDDEVANENKLPEVLTDEQKQELTAYLTGEYQETRDAYAGRNAKVAKWRKEVEAFSSDVPKNHPFKNASNVRVPIMQMIVEAAYARIKGAFSARDNLWVVESTRTGSTPDDEKSRQLAKCLTEYLDVLARSPTDLNMEAFNADAIMDAVITGTVFPKVVWTKHAWNVRTNDSGAADKEVVAHLGPEVIPIPIERVWFKKGIRNLQTAPWIAVDIPYTEIELRAKARQGIFDPDAVAKVLGAGARTQLTDIETEAAKSEDVGEDVGVAAARFDVTEFYVFYDVDGDGGMYDLIVHMHVDSGTILSVQYNSYGYRLISPIRFSHRQYSITGRGLGQKLESMQTEVDAIHNMRNDNMKLANTRMIVTRRGALRGSSIDNVFAGRNIEVDMPSQDVQAFQLGEVYPSSLQAEGQSIEYAHRAGAFNETMMGHPSKMLGSRDTARGQAMRLQTGDSLFEDIVSGMVRAYSTVGMMVVMQLIAHREDVVATEKMRLRLSEEKLQMLDEALAIGIDEISTRFNFRVQTQDMEKTMESKRQNLLTLTQLFTQFAQQTVPMAMQLMGPQGQQMAQQAPEAYAYMMRILTGAGLMMSDVFKFFGEMDTQNYLPDFKKYDMMLDTMVQMQGQMQGQPQMQGPMQEVPNVPVY